MRVIYCARTELSKQVTFQLSLSGGLKVCFQQQFFKAYSGPRGEKHFCLSLGFCTENLWSQMGHRVFLVFLNGGQLHHQMGRRFPLCCQKIRRKRHLPSSCTFLLCPEIPQAFQEPGNDIGMQILPSCRGLTHQHCWKFTSRSIRNASRQQLSRIRREKSILSVKGLCGVRCSGLVFGKH